jgi:chromosome segregation protein
LAALESEAKALIKAVETSTGDRAILHLKADPGFERALGAALGDDLDAAVSATARGKWAGAAIRMADPPSQQGQARSRLMFPLRQLLHAPRSGLRGGRG